MGRYLAYGLLIFCTLALVDVYCYEKCTHGFIYKVCYIGSCCQINDTWYCTYDTSNCDSLALTTTKRTTTKRPTTVPNTRTRFTGPWYTTAPNTRARDSNSSSNSVILPVLLSLGGAAVLGVCLIVFCICLNSKRNSSPGTIIRPGIQSPVMNPVYYVNGTDGSHQLSSNPPVYQVKKDEPKYVSPNTGVGGTNRSHQLSPSDHHIQMNGPQLYSPSTRVTGTTNAGICNSPPPKYDTVKDKHENKLKNGVPSL